MIGGHREGWGNKDKQHLPAGQANVPAMKNNSRMKQPDRSERNGGTWGKREKQSSREGHAKLIDGVLPIGRGELFYANRKTGQSGVQNPQISGGF